MADTAFSVEKARTALDKNLLFIGAKAAAPGLAMAVCAGNYATFITLLVLIGADAASVCGKTTDTDKTSMLRTLPEMLPTTCDLTAGADGKMRIGLPGDIFSQWEASVGLEPLGKMLDGSAFLDPPSAKPAALKVPKRKSSGKKRKKSSDSDGDGDDEDDETSDPVRSAAPLPATKIRPFFAEPARAGQGTLAPPRARATPWGLPLPAAAPAGPTARRFRRPVFRCFRRGLLASLAPLGCGARGTQRS